MVEVLVVAEVILAVHVVVMDVEVVELSMSDWSVPFSSGETRVCSWEVSSNPLEASLKPHFQVLQQICYAYAMPLCLTFWSIKVQYSTARKRSEVIWPVCDLGKHATYTPYISQVTPILPRLWGYGHVDQCLGHFKMTGFETKTITATPMVFRLTWNWGCSHGHAEYSKLSEHCDCPWLDLWIE